MLRGNWLPCPLLSLAVLVVNTTLVLADEKAESGPDANVLTIVEFDRLQQKLTRMSNERVWSIPWQLSVCEARELAAKENKPVFCGYRVTVVLTHWGRVEALPV